MPVPDYNIKTTVAGKRIVQYRCSSCRDMLENALAKAGSKDRCPGCGAEHTVPGASEFAAERAKRAMDEARRGAEEQRRQAEHAATVARETHVREAKALRDAEQVKLREEVGKREREDARWRSGFGLGVFGWLLWVLAFFMLIAASAMDVTAAGSEVLNIGLLNARSNLFVCTGAVVIVGAVFLVGGLVCERIGRLLRQVAEASRR